MINLKSISGVSSFFFLYVKAGSGILWLVEVITTRRDCWRNCSFLSFYDQVLYSSTNPSQNMWSSCAVILCEYWVKHLIHAHINTQWVLSNSMCCEAAEKADTKQLSRLNIWSWNHFSEASLRVKGSKWPNPWPLESLAPPPSQPWLTT